MRQVPCIVCKPISCTTCRPKSARRNDYMSDKQNESYVRTKSMHYSLILLNIYCLALASKNHYKATALVQVKCSATSARRMPSALSSRYSESELVILSTGTSAPKSSKLLHISMGREVATTSTGYAVVEKFPAEGSLTVTVLQQLCCSACVSLTDAVNWHQDEQVKERYVTVKGTQLQSRQLGTMSSFG